MSERGSTACAAHLLGRHVADRAEHHAGFGPAARSSCPRGASASARISLASPKSRILTASVAGDEQVLGLEVAVDDAALVRGRQAARDLHRVLDRLAKPAADRRSAARAASRLRAARDDVGRAVVLTDVVDDEDVRMVERARRARLLLEAAQPIGSSADVPRAAP